MNENAKKLGIIGGLGPMATVFFQQMIIDMTDAATDQEHIPTVVASRPDTPDRTAFILGRSSRDPLPYLLDSGRTLEKCGADCIALPCVTAFYFYEQLSGELSVPLLHAPRETSEYLRAAGIERAGIMSTEGTAQARILQRELERVGIAPVLPDAAAQRAVTSVIYDYVKASRPVDMALFDSAADMLRNAGAQCIILGCTELSVVRRDNELRGCFIDVLEVLAAGSIAACGAVMKPQYADLIHTCERK